MQILKQSKDSQLYNWLVEKYVDSTSFGFQIEIHLPNTYTTYTVFQVFFYM